MVVTKKFFKSRNFLDIGSIPFSTEDYINESNNLTQYQTENIMFPEMRSPLQQELIYWHDKLPHLHSKSMFRLANIGGLPSIFLDLKDYVPFFASCMIGTAMRSQRRKKGKKSGSIRKETEISQALEYQYTNLSHLIQYQSHNFQANS